MNPRAFVGVVGLLVLASCFNGARTPVATLAPRSADALPRTHGPFSVVYAAPKGKVVDRKQSAGVTVLFSRALRSVDTADDEHVPNVTIKTKTGGDVRGTWRFTGTRGLLFRPEGELPGGSDFVVTVPADTRALDGSTLGNPYTFELETPGPSPLAFDVVGPNGTTEKSMPADAAFRLTFDQAVDPAAVALATTLRVFKGDGDRGEAVKVSATRDAAFTRHSNVREEQVVLLRPEKPLPPDHQVELTVASTLRGIGGPRPMATPYTHVMRTHGPLRFVDFSCPRIETKGRCKANGDVKVVLSNPVAPQELKNHVKLAKLPPRTPGKNEKKRVDPSTDHWLGVAPKLGEQYRVVLTAGMKDIYGQTLDKDATFEIDVEAPLVKPANVPAPAPVASAKPALHHPAPQPPPSDPRPRREHLPYRLELGLAGQVLEAKSSHKVAASAINIPTYSEVATALTDDQAASWLLARGSTTDFLGRNGIASTWVDAHGPQNERTVRFVDLDGVLAQRKGRGPALVVLNPPGTAPDGYGRTESFVTVTDLGVTAKMSPYGSLVWVTSLASGKPIANATVALRVGPKNGHLGGETWHGTTDADGVALVPLDAFDPIAKEGSGESIRDDAAIVVRSGDDWTITKVVRSSVEARLTSGFASMSKSGKWAGTIFADRGVFRPGETAKVAGIVRVVETSGLRAIPGRELRVELKDRNGEQIFDGRATCDEFGTFALDVPIPKTAELGQATIVASARPGGKSNTTESGVFRHDVRILAYKANEFKVSADTDKPAYVRGDDATLTVHGDYLYGAPMSGAAVTSSVTRQEVPFTPPLTEGFVTSDEIFTGDVPETTEEAQAIQSQDGSLDGEGRFTRKVDLTFDDQKRPERISFDATVTDLSRRDVSARATAILHPAEFYVAIKQPSDRFVASGTAFKPEIAAVDPKGIRRGGVNVKVELVERKWNAVVGEQPDGRATKSTKPQDVVLSSCDAQTNAKTASCDLRVPHAGYFVVRATASDPRGNTVRSSTAIYGTEDAVANTTTASTAWAADDRHGVKLEPNKKTYEVGDTAKIVLRSPFKEGEALVTVERNGVLWRQVVPIKGPLPVVQVPVKPELYPNAYVSVVAVRGRIADPPSSGGVDLGAPDYRFGWAKLEVNQEAHRLKVNVAAAHPEYQPGAMVDTDVVVTDRAGKPVSTSLTFYVVDEGVLALTSYVTPDPLPAFVEPRGLSVFTFDNRELLAHLIPMKAGERVPSLGWEYAISKTPTTYDKGDDGGDGPAAMKRADFRTTAYFETGKRTDANGKARFSFKLPDNLTTFRMMAVAAAADDRFGSGDSQVTTFRRLMARPALPRLVRVGDQLEASVVVSSKPDPNGGPNMNVDVKMEAKGLVLAGPAARTITMARGGQAEVRFPVKATAPGDAVVSFEVRSGSDVDKVEMTRHVELPVSVESTAVYGEAAGDIAVALGDLKDIRHDQGGLTVRVTPSALVGLATTIEHLEDYPYGCTEQLTSRLVPLVALGDLTKDSGAKLPKDVDQTIDGIVETMLKRQDYDGGFGFWDKGSAEPWLTAYALMGIHGAVDRKRFVPKDVLERGKDYLSSTLVASLRKFTPTPKDDEDPKDDADAGPESIEARQKLEDQKAIDYGTAALLADTLVDLGWTGPGTLNILYDARAGKRLFAQAALLHAMAKSEMSGKQVDTLRREVESRLRVGPNEVDVDESENDTFAVLLDSHARTLAMVLRALLAVDPHHPLAPRMAKKLLALRQDTGAWRNTQEDAWSLMALADYRRLQESSASDHTVRVMLGGSELLKTEFPRGSMREDKVLVAPDVLASKGGPLAFEVSGDGPIHFAAELKYATAALPTRARDEGLFVQKYVRGVPASEVQKVLATIPKKTADSVGAGELVIVDLLFESAEPREQVVVDDPLPAGLEALDYGIDTTSQATRDAENKRDDAKTTWLGTTFRAAESRREVRDDRVLTFYKHIEPGMYRVQYLARATSIGTFVVPPTRIEAMYSPEVYGRTPATTLVVRSK